MRFTSNPHPARSWGVDDDGDERDFYSGQTAPAELKTGGSCLSPSRRDLYCPHCNSHRIVPSHLARRVGSAIGTIAGAATATTRVAGGAYLGAEFGALLGGRAGPAGFTLGTVAGALLGAMAGAAAGCAVGAALGEAIDAKILHNHQCIDCGRGFSLQTE